MNCRHALPEAWCSFCNDDLELRLGKVTRENCCAPACHRTAEKQVAGLPLCLPHFHRLETAVAVTRPRSEPAIPKAIIPLGWVYFIQLGEYIKIGHSVNPASRFTAYTNVPSRILGFEFGDRNLERRIHRRFAEHEVAELVGAREMFHPHPDIINYIVSERTCVSCKQKTEPLRVFCSKHVAGNYEDVEPMTGRTNGHPPDLAALEGTPLALLTVGS